MPAKKDDKIQENDTRLRLFYLYRLLEQHTDEEHPKTTNQLRDLMEKEHGIAMHRTTVYNDIELLKKQAFISTATVPGQMSTIWRAGSLSCPS